LFENIGKSGAKNMAKTELTEKIMPVLLKKNQIINLNAIP